MTYGNFAYGSAAIGGDIITTITCNPPNANLIVMDRLLEIGYTVEDASKIINLMNENKLKNKLKNCV